ncbi:hypothetical protein EJ08DRAFT_656756 [Tothia fuscella]|uniref:C2 domain-containing protein n=1 Tax=Tothia fuscella TaxID=1048955 RepID=A0A9P4P0Q0_9PEZI|nr:hypothetical protein EJ08DRAFT_656756 [Tothia fuscella]
MASMPAEAEPNGNQHDGGPQPDDKEKSQGDINEAANVAQSSGVSSQKSKETDEKVEKQEEDHAKGKKQQKDDKQPDGGYDSTPIPYAPPGYTVRITFHKAENLPMADINSFSSDPFVVATLSTGLPTRHKEDPPLIWRTPTVRRNVDPEWQQDWIVANIPAAGFRLKCRLYDEDPADHDDRLGNVVITVPSVSEQWEGIRHQQYKIKKRMGSKRAYLMRAIAVCLKTAHDMSGYLYLSVEVLGRTETDEGGRAYTVGPMWWTKHFSPLLGRIAGRKEPGEDNESNHTCKSKKAERYNFQANQFQFQGPVPPELYHRYVEFKSFVKGMFTSSGIQGYLLSKALHHQHASVYNFDRTTEYGQFEGPSKETTLKFLDLVHYDQGGRIFTYVLTLDSLFRFTETGKEFGIDFLSKHTMHSDVSAYIAYSGEFFIRRLKHKNRPPPEEGGHNKSHPANEISNGPPNDDAPNDPGYYEIVIDNDSGTYRPNGALLPKLKEFLQQNLPGLKVVTLDCQKDAELEAKMKKEQREAKEKEGDHIIYRQMSRGSSISSSDLDELDEAEREQREHRGVLGQAKHEITMVGKSRQAHWKTVVQGKGGDVEAGAATGGVQKEGAAAADHESRTHDITKADDSNR